MAVKDYLNRLRGPWGALAIAAAAIVTFRKELADVIEASKFVIGVPAAVWARWGSTQFGIALTILTVTVALLAGMWWQEVIPAVRERWRKSPARVVIKAGASVALLAGIAAILTVVLLHDAEPGRLRDLFAQADTLNTIAIRTFGNNGKATYTMLPTQSPSGPRAFARVTLAPSKDTAESNCGLIIIFLSGTNLERFTELHFMLRGARGGEKLDIKAKDATGEEVRIHLDGSRFIPDQRIATSWKEVTIPLSSFGNVKFGFFENLSLSVSGDRAGAEPQIIDVGGFEFR